MAEAVVSCNPVRHLYIILIKTAMDSQISHHCVPSVTLLLVESITTGHYLVGDILVVGWGEAEAVVSCHPICHYNFILIECAIPSL